MRAAGGDAATAVEVTPAARRRDGGASAPGLQAGAGRASLGGDRAARFALQLAPMVLGASPYSRTWAMYMRDSK